MNHSDKRLEAELSELRPSQPSAELERRIAERLASGDVPLHPRPLSREGRGGKRTLRWGWLLAAAAAGITAIVLLPRNDHHPPADRPADASQSQLASAFDDTLPTLWQYRAALNRSASELDAVLDKHAAHTPEPKPERARVFVFSPLHFDTDSLGDL